MENLTANIALTRNHDCNKPMIIKGGRGPLVEFRAITLLQSASEVVLVR